MQRGLSFILRHTNWGKAWKSAIGLCMALVCAQSVAASDVESLGEGGYSIVETTQVISEYYGCNFNRQIQFVDGLIFICNYYNYHYAYMPQVFILKNPYGGALKVIIDGEEVIGTLYRQQLTPIY